MTDRHFRQRPDQHGIVNGFQILSLLLGMLFFQSAWPDDPRETIEFDIEPQSLTGALNQFAVQSNLTLTYRSEIAENLQSPGLKGAYLPEQALKQLLDSAPIEYRFSARDTVVLGFQHDSGLNTATLLAMNPMDDFMYAAAEPEQSHSVEPVEQEDLTVRGAPLSAYNVLNASTATRTDTPIMETPISIEVIPRAVIQDQQAIQLGGAVKNVSGVFQGFTFGGFSEEFIIRGFNTSFANYLDGYRFPAIRISNAITDHVEVVKGAAANLYGRVQPGGLINVVTKRPLDSPYYSLQQQFGSFDLYRTTLDATGPVGSNESVRYRFNLEYLDRNSFRDFAFTERILVAPSLSWDLGERTRFDLDFIYSDEDTLEDLGLPAIGNRPASVPISRYLGEPSIDKSNTTLTYVNATLNHQFNDDWKIRAKFVNLIRDADDRIHRNIALNTTTGDLTRRFFGGKSTDLSFYGNLDLTGHFDTWGAEHTVLLGWDYYSTDTEATAASLLDTPINLFNPIYGRSSINLSTLQNNRFIDQEINWTAVYFQDQITLWDKLHILGGGRYDWATTGLGFAAGQGLSLADARANFSEVQNNRFSPRVGVVYQPWAWLSMYGNYVESLGNPNSGVSRSGTAFPPEIGEQYEVGFKTEFFDRRLTSTLAFYHLTKQNVLVPVPGTLFSDAIGEARSRGIELDIAGQITEGLSLIATYALTDTRITKGANQGNRLFNVPKNAGSLWAKYDVQQASLRGLSFGAGVYLVSTREGDNANTFQLPGYGRVDAMLRYQLPVASSKISFQLNIENLLDHQYYVSTSGDRFTAIPGAPRTFIGALRIEY